MSSEMVQLWWRAVNERWNLERQANTSKNNNNICYNERRVLCVCVRVSYKNVKFMRSKRIF